MSTLRKMLGSLRSSTGSLTTAAWSKDQWREHLLRNAMGPSERAEIEAIFAREM